MNMYEKYQKDCTELWKSEIGKHLAYLMCDDKRSPTEKEYCIKETIKKKLQECWVTYNEGKENFRRFHNDYESRRQMPNSKNFPNTLNVSILYYCKWEDHGSNIHSIYYYSWNIFCSVKVKDRGEDLIRYESERLKASYIYHSVGIMKDPKDVCFGKAIEKSFGEGTSSSSFILDISLEEYWKLAGTIPYSYSLFINFEGKYLAKSVKTCEPKKLKSGIMPFSFIIVPNEQLFSTIIGSIRKADDPGFVCLGKGYEIWQFK